MHIFFNFSLLFPCQPRLYIFSILQEYFELKITIFWTALPKRQSGKCLCLCFHTINMTKYFILVLILLLFSFHGNTCYDVFLHAIMHFSMHQNFAIFNIIFLKISTLFFLFSLSISKLLHIFDHIEIFGTGYILF